MGDGGDGDDLSRLLAANHRWDDREQRWVFSSSGFYSDWFRGPHSHPYFFLFKKNLAVTNLQFAELLALLRTFSTRAGDAERAHLQFYSTEEFNSRIGRLLGSLADSHEPPGRGDERAIDDVCGQFAHHWGDLLAQTAVVDAFYGSCVVFLPPGVEIDLATVCGLSGYIHSCGPSVWARKVGKAKPDELIEKLADRVPDRQEQRAMFAVYSHEDFTEFDREEASELRDGLDDVKIWVGKYWMDKERLVSMLKRLRDRVPGLEVAGSGDYREIREELHNRADMDKDRCFWLVVDRGVSADGQHPSRERYYHCYEQHYCNESPLHMFDENKPAWRSHTTLPHTLTGAMLNLTLPYWTSRAPSLVDPFVGTGTTLLEAAKFEELTVRGIDSDPLARLLVSDNLYFFTRDAAELDELHMCLAHAIAIEEERGDRSVVDADLVKPETWLDTEFLHPEVERLVLDRVANQRVIDAYQKAEVTVMPVAERPEDEVTVGASKVAELESWTFEERLFFYVGLRAVRRNVGARDEEERARYRQAWIREAKVLANQLSKISRRARHPVLDGSRRGVEVVSGFYSRACKVSRRALTRLAAVAGIVRCEDATNFDEHVDLVITDPPYGFNTDADSDELATLFAGIIERVLGRLNDGGQVVMALPEQSFVGRDPAFFADRRFVEQQIAARAHDLRRELVSSAEVVPSDPPIFEGPYYWESERALRRSIVHYRIGPESAMRREAGGGPASVRTAGASATAAQR